MKMEPSPAVVQPFGSFRVPDPDHQLVEFGVQGRGPHGLFDLGTVHARDEAHAAELARQQWPGVAVFGRLVVV